MIELPSVMALGPAKPAADVLKRLNSLSISELLAPDQVVDAPAGRACLAGLRLIIDDLDGCHKIAQELPTPEGAYWHGMIHRREGDFWNAKYWFRKAKSLPAFDSLGETASQICASQSDVPEWIATRRWDAFGFTDWVEECLTGKSTAGKLCAQVHKAEWQALFDHCRNAAIGR